MYRTLSSFSCYCSLATAKKDSKAFMQRRIKRTVILPGWHAYFVSAAKQKVSVQGHCIMSFPSVVNTLLMFPSHCRTKSGIPIRVNTLQHHHLMRKIIFVIGCLRSISPSWEAGFGGTFDTVCDVKCLPLPSLILIGDLGLEPHCSFSTLVPCAPVLLGLSLLKYLQLALY